jgi:hypothetical protein
MFVMAIRRKADIIRLDAKADNENIHTTHQRAAEIIALCDALERALGDLP